MGEILRAVVDEQCLFARPRFYVGTVAMAAQTAGVTIEGNIRIQENTQFLWTSFGFYHKGSVAGVLSTDFGALSQVAFRDFSTGRRFSNVSNISVLSNTYPFGVTEQEEYPLFPGNYRLGWTVTPLIVRDTDAYYLLFGGIEYVMPGSNADYGIQDFG